LELKLREFLEFSYLRMNMKINPALFYSRRRNARYIEHPARYKKCGIKVIGVGGAGTNAIARLTRSGIKNIELIALNTDAQDLKKKNAHFKLRIGERITQGLGTGMNPKIGKLAAEESYQEISEILNNTDLVFLTAGLGGGTGSGAMPVIAEIAKNLGILTIGVVTLPFSFEGKKRRKVALTSLKELRKKIDTLVVIRNDKLLKTVPLDLPVEFAFSKCDEILKEAVESISNVILNPGILNLDFADIKAILKQGGTAFFGIGKAQGKGRAQKAARIALFSPLSRFPLKRTEGVLFNVASYQNSSLNEIAKIGQLIKKEVPSEAKIIFGASLDRNLQKDELRVTVIAAGFKI